MSLAQLAEEDRFILTPVELSTIVQSRIFRVVVAVWVVGLFGFQPLRFDGLAVLGAITVKAGVGCAYAILWSALRGKSAPSSTYAPCPVFGE